MQALGLLGLKLAILVPGFRWAASQPWARPWALAAGATLPLICLALWKLRDSETKTQEHA